MFGRCSIKQNGHLIIGDPWAPSPFRQIANFSFRFGKDGGHKIYSSREMATMLNKIGFNSIGWQRAGFAFILTAES